MRLSQSLALLFLSALSAHASLNRDGLRGLDHVHSAQTMGHSRMGIGFMADVTANKSIFKNSELTRIEYPGTATLDSTTSAILGYNDTKGAITGFTGVAAYPFLSLGIGNYVDLAASLPIYYDAVATDRFTNWGADAPPGFIDNTQHPGFSGLTKAYPGDLRTNFKFRLPIPEDEYIIDVAALFGATIPTTNRKKQGAWLHEIDYVRIDSGYASPFGNQSSTLKGALLTTFDFNRLADPLPILVDFNAGYRAPSSNKYSPVVFYGANLEFIPVEFLSLYASYWHEKASKPVKWNGIFEEELAVDYLNTGVVVHTDAGIELYLSANLNLNSGAYLDTVRAEIGEVDYKYGVRTAPDLWATAGFTWNGFLVAQDRDKDGILDKNDKCPDDMEDEDEFQDEDGCPETDNDRDGIDDTEDDCPIQPEDMDEFMDEDGCPDPDNDGDQVLDNVDRCSAEPEDKDAFEDGDGCPDPDNDKDGFLDADDKCPDAAETKNNIDDEDGCPEGDADFDGLLDNVDKCPTQKEDFDAYQDEDGCPEADNDGDGNADVTDKCPNDPETKNGVQDEDGCPEGDIDNDGIKDDVDECPTQPEDMDGFEDKNGCPDPDNDSDGILDAVDKCPVDKETMNEHEDTDGCPDTKPKPIEKQITLRGVNFKSGTADLTPESRAILDPIVEQLKGSPEVKVEIQGHTDDQGSDAANQALSERRAQAVIDYFSFQGVDKARMSAVGYGEAKPIASNKTAEGRALNRRIEMKRLN